uniref:Polyprenol reductase n=1 Tax=Kalanchoe fedtschenkoi TaxID=63787 RepID=A0A7N0UGL2_KALFE
MICLLATSFGLVGDDGGSRIPYSNPSFNLFAYPGQVSMIGLTELSQVLRLREIRLSWLLQSWWIAGILPILVASIPSSRLASFRNLVLGFARRGKTMPPSSSSQKFTVPQKFFLHFYVFSVVWTTALLVLTWNYAYKVAPLDSDSMKYVASHLTGGAHIFSLHKSYLTSVSQRYLVWRSVFLLLLMEIQALRRLYETLYVFKYSHSARMHILAYLTGY